MSSAEESAQRPMSTSGRPEGQEDRALAPQLRCPGLEVGVVGRVLLDNSPHVVSFVKNQGLGFAIPYLHAGRDHEYFPDFLVRLMNGLMVILETKGHNEREGVKVQAAERWALSRYLKYVVAQLIVELWRWISVGALVFQAAASSAVTSHQTAKRSSISVRHWVALSRCRRGRKCAEMPLKADRNRWACRTDLKRFIARSRCRVG